MLPSFAAWLSRAWLVTGGGNTSLSWMPAQPELQNLSWVLNTWESFPIPTSRVLNISGLTTLIPGCYLNATFTSSYIAVKIVNRIKFTKASKDGRGEERGGEGRAEPSRAVQFLKPLTGQLKNGRSHHHLASNVKIQMFSHKPCVVGLPVQKDCLWEPLLLSVFGSISVQTSTLHTHTHIFIRIHQPSQE